MSVTVDPAAITVPASGGTSTHTITNSEDGRIMFKIRISHKDQYSINPVHGFIDAGATAQLEVVRKPGPPMNDKMVIVYMQAPEGATNAFEEWKKQSTIMQQTKDVTIPCKAE